MGQITVFNEAAEVFDIKFRVNHLVEAGFDLWPVPFPDCLNQKVTKRPVFEHFAQHIENGAPQVLFVAQQSFSKSRWKTCPSRVSIATRFHK